MAQPSRSQIPMKEVMTNPIKHTNQCFVKICPEPVSSVTQSDEYILLCPRKSGDATTTETDDTQEHFISSYKQYRKGRKTMSMLVGAQN